MNKRKIFLLIITCLLALLFPKNTFAENTIKIYFFHGDGCPHCAEESKFLEELVSENKEVELIKYEVWYHPDNAKFLERVKKEMNINRSGVPVTIIGKTAIVGYSDSVGYQIKRAITYYSEQDYDDVIKKIENGESINIVDNFSELEEKSDYESTISVPFFGNINLKRLSISTSAVLIGLVDGFNPCAMWILLFLISVLIGMKNRKRMWIYGFTFLISSALVYMVIMLSWLAVSVKITTSIWIRNLIALIAISGGIINLKSYITSRKDSGCQVVDKNRRTKIFDKIKKFTHEKSFILGLVGIIGLAVSVNLVELACSAGLPLIFTQLLAINHITGMRAFLYTLLYIVFFLFDDFVVFFVAMFTMKISGISTRYTKYSHLIGGLLMLLIGVLLIFKPEWLMFQFN